MKTLEHMNEMIKELKDKGILDPQELSDGYHTFCELYKHRNLLFVKLAKMVKESGKLPVWRSIKNSDGSVWKGWFIIGVGKDSGEQMTYHVPIDMWDLTMFAETLDISPWDGHTSDDVLERLLRLL